MMRHLAANALTLMILLLVGLVAVIFWGQRMFFAPGPHDAPVIIEVERGDSLIRVTRRLEEAGVIRNATVFRIGARYTALDQGLRFGEYEIPVGASMEDVLLLLNSGQGIQRRVIIPEGWTSWQVVEHLNGIELLTGEITEIPPEGSIAPAAYDYVRGDDRQTILNRMMARQEQILAEAWEARDPDLPLESPEELLILASIVEKETGVPEERGLVASVMINRLRTGMRLQTDPTVIYGITQGRGSLGRGLTRSELDTPTPYNTYQIDGLPAGPIANPGRAALMAAAQPPESEYFYFVADGTGGHAFSRTLAEHNANVAAWRRIEAERAAARDGAMEQAD